MKKSARIAALSLAMAIPATQALAIDEHFIDDAAVVGGYDVVSYHTVGKPIKGSADGPCVIEVTLEKNQNEYPSVLGLSLVKQLCIPNQGKVTANLNGSRLVISIVLSVVIQLVTSQYQYGN